MADKKVIRTIGVLTSGGDAPGMNAAIRAVVRTALSKGLKVRGIRRGYQGLLNEEIIDLSARDVSDTIERGGTILQTARCAEMRTEEGQQKAAAICKKYGIRSKSKLQKWIKKYNGHEELKSSGTGGSIIMTKGRKTTFEERVEIVQYCIAHDRNYAQTAEQYQVSYQQARNYIVKYEAGGVEALRDNRGKRKCPDEMSELEKLRAEVKILKAEKERAEMEASFLKKLEEIERRRG